MIVQYHGLNYNGFQKQNNKNTIQDKLEEAIFTITKEKVTCVGSGRTDAKVNAYFQPVHFDVEKEINTEKVLYSLNGILPIDIKVLSLIKSDLHARFDAKSKTYIYKMYISNVDLPLCANALRINNNLNFKEMKKFLKLLVGKHDFAGFMASGSQVDSTIRTIYKANLVIEKEYLNLHISGNGFLYKMVRNIIGTMLKIGEGKLNLTEIKPTLFTTFKSTHTAKPEYLYLKDVTY